MSRRIIIVICCINVLLAGGTLWYLFGARPNDALPSLNTDRRILTDTERWALATSASHPQEAAYQFNLFQDTDRLKQLISESIHTLANSGNPELSRWPFYRAAIQIYAKEGHNLSLLERIAMNGGQPLVIRDTAFRALVENAVLLKRESGIHDEVLPLIDRFFDEANSLSETALHAEHFLVSKRLLTDDRVSAFNTRLESVLNNRQNTEDKRIAALIILKEMDAVTESAYEKLYSDAGLGLQTSILHALSGMNLSEPTKQWLINIEPKTPEQEQLLLSMLTAAE